MSLDLETGSLLGFGSDWTTVRPSETSILAEIGMGQLGRSATVKYWSCWLGGLRRWGSEEWLLGKPEMPSIPSVGTAILCADLV